MPSRNEMDRWMEMTEAFRVKLAVACDTGDVEMQKELQTDMAGILAFTKEIWGRQNA